jgi:hypothetical protein
LNTILIPFVASILSEGPGAVAPGSDHPEFKQVGGNSFSRPMDTALAHVVANGRTFDALICPTNAGDA